MTLMDGDSPWPILIILLLLGGAVYFALAETAFASVNRIRIKTRAERGSNRAERRCLSCADGRTAAARLQSARS